MLYTKNYRLPAHLQTPRMYTYKDLEMHLYKGFGLFVVVNDGAFSMDCSYGWEHLGGQVLPIEVKLATHQRSFHKILRIAYGKIRNVARNAPSDVPDGGIGQSKHQGDQI